MKQLKKVLVILAAAVSLFVAAGCSNLTKEANTKDTWSRIKRRKSVIIGLDDTFVPMDFRQKDGKLVGYDVDLAKASLRNWACGQTFRPLTGP